MNAEPKKATTADERATALREAGMTAFDAPVLKEIGSTAMVSGSALAFLPTSMAEAMELAKLMACSNFVAPHLRRNPGDCLAVVMQASRWGMDPFAVANKSFFVNERISYESQLVNAVVNSSRALEGRLTIEWDGEGEALTCKVSGKIKGDPEIKPVWQELKSITTRNSPLWKTSPRQQLAYYTTRLWARLHVPEVLMGVYTPDELEGEQRQADGSFIKAPERPTRAKVREDATRLDEEFRATVGGGQHQGAPAESDRGGEQSAGGEEGAGGEQQQGEQGSGEQSAEDDAAAVAAEQKQIEELVDVIVGEINSQSFTAGIDNVIEKYGSDIDWLKEVSADAHQRVLATVTAKRVRLQNRGKGPRG